MRCFRHDEAMVDKGVRLPNIFYRFLISRNLISISFTTFIVYYLWIIVEKFRSVFLAGLIATIYLAVQLISSIPIGHLIDRLNNTVLSLISSFVTLFGFTFLLFGNSIFIVYSTTALITLGLTLKGDSFSAIIKKHLKDDLFRRANSRNYAAISFSTLIGTALGGLSILYLGRYLVYILLAIVVVSILSSLPVEEEVTAGISASAIGELYSALGFFRKIFGFCNPGIYLEWTDNIS